MRWKPPLESSVIWNRSCKLPAISTSSPAPPAAQGIKTTKSSGNFWLTVNVSAAAEAEVGPSRATKSMITTSRDNLYLNPILRVFIAHLLWVTERLKLGLHIDLGSSIGNWIKHCSILFTPPLPTSKKLSSVPCETECTPPDLP